MSRKKILWLCSWYPAKTDPYNGDFIQRHARAAALYNDIYIIHVAGDETGNTKKPEEGKYQSEGLTEHIIYYQKSTSFFGRLLSHFRWLRLFKAAINNYIGNNGIPDVVHVHVPVKAGLFALWFKRKYKVPFVVTEHWGIYNDVEIHNYQGKSVAFRQLTRRVFEKADVFLSVSQFLAEGVNKLVVEKKYEIIPNVTDTSVFYYKDRKNVVFRFIHVSNMVPLKNAEGILMAFRLLLQQITNVELVMVGDTNTSIRNFAKELGLTGSQVLFRGEIPYYEVAREIQEADCLVLFSNIENSPCVIGEALCCGLPVIATKVGGIPELVNEENSILIEPKDEKALVAAMQEMIARFSEFKHKKIAEKAQSRFSYPVAGKKFNEIYSLLAARN